MPVLSPVRVIRYVRPRLENYCFSNLGGVTFVFTLDYNLRTVEVQTAICSSKDNFNKADGLKYALESSPRKFNLDKFQAFADEEGGFVHAYIAVLKSEAVSEAVLPSEKVLLRKMADQRLIP